MLLQVADTKLLPLGKGSIGQRPGREQGLGQLTSSVGLSFVTLLEWYPTRGPAACSSSKGFGINAGIVLLRGPAGGRERGY